MNLNAHFAWAFAFWGSAELARRDGNSMLSPIGFYYSTFHAAYAYLNAVPGIEPVTFDRMGHRPLSNLIEQHIGDDLSSEFDILMDLRETINYLGFGSPEGKLRIVRGHPLHFGVGTKEYTFDEVVDLARDKSRAMITRVLDKLATLQPKAVDTIPVRGDEDQNWLEEYMQEDILLNVIHHDARGRVLILMNDLLS